MKIISNIKKSFFRKTWLASLTVLLAGIQLTGQSDDMTRINLGFPVYSQYLQNGMAINPAYTGTREVLSGFMSYRIQWMGTNGSPLLQSVSLHSPMKNDKVGLGLTAQFLSYGTTKSTSLMAVMPITSV